MPKSSSRIRCGSRRQVMRPQARARVCSTTQRTDWLLSRVPRGGCSRVESLDVAPGLGIVVVVTPIGDDDLRSTPPPASRLHDQHAVAEHVELVFAVIQDFFVGLHDEVFSAESRSEYDVTRSGSVKIRQ